MDVAFVTGTAPRRRPGSLDPLGHGYLESATPLNRLFGLLGCGREPGLISWAADGPLGVTMHSGESFTLSRAGGTDLRCEAGCLWITEEGIAEDATLVAGQSARLVRHGKALVLALRDSRLLLDGHTSKEVT